MFAKLDPRRRACEFCRFLDLIDEGLPDKFAVHVVFDNISTHRTAESQR